MPHRLIFVYNADSGLFSEASAFAARLFAPDKYPCSLCMVTSSLFGAMKDEWAAFLKTLPYPYAFLHRNEFRRAYPDLFRKVALPVILHEHDGEYEILFSHDDLKSNADGLRTFMARMREKVDEIRP